MTDTAAAVPGDIVCRPRINPPTTPVAKPLAVPSAATPTPTTTSASASASAAPASPRDCCTTGSFVTKLYKMVDSEPATIVSWIRGGTAFCIVDPKMMAEHCLPKYFRHRRFSSLIRQLNFYSFYRVQEGQLTIYQHSYFRKGRPDLLVHIKRRGAGKAKDPWFDPLAPMTKPPMPLGMHDLMIHAPMDMLQSGLVSPHPMMCYSPMAKPLPAAAMDNMSPALKPTMAAAGMPPAVELGGKVLMDSLQRWGVTVGMANPMMDLDDTKFQLNASPAQNPTAALMKPAAAPTMVSPNLDLDIQDFLTEECAIVPDFMEDKRVNSNTNTSKRAMVARDFMKWDTKDDDESERPDDMGMETESRPMDSEPVDSFERELLLDLATVEPGAWDVPLSPLNEEEDMMPWLDLCL